MNLRNMLKAVLGALLTLSACVAPAASPASPAPAGETPFSATLPPQATSPSLPPPSFSTPGDYDPGQPALREIWVDPQNGDDGSDGAFAFRTLSAAWRSLPMNTSLTEGVLIRLKPGDYPPESLPNYWESRHGAFEAPIWIRGEGSAPEDVVLQGYVNIFDTDYLYFENLTIRTQGDVFHCEQCDHIWLRNVVLDGGGAAHETVKVNQSRHIYIENSDLSGAWENVIDFVAVQYGHLRKNEIHGGGDWCAYVKGGSAYLRVEANLIYDCGTGGFTAGQGTGFQFMTPPWIQYEAYDIAVVNNLIRDTEGAGLGVNGGYNILMAYNTLIRVGRRSHVIEVVFGGRSCDGEPGEPGRERCQQYLEQGGWGTTEVDDGTNDIAIPNKNVFIYNNLVYNPPGFESAWQHFAIFAARQNPAWSNIPYAAADENLQIRGNLIWNGDANMPLGIEGEGNGCAPANPVCNEAQLRAGNAINTVRPLFVDEAGGDFHPAGDWAQTVTLFPLPDFVWELSVPPGVNDNDVLLDRDGQNRAGRDAPGAYALTSLSR
ncbi:MAG: right-handed parallel beta-helix repeat-containing protein [Anaerolineales bacterium]|nr:right-handed parallel beta-helix repeat-containing protein [Anaerolineales bacterium]